MRSAMTLSASSHDTRLKLPAPFALADGRIQQAIGAALAFAKSTNLRADVSASDGILMRPVNRRDPTILDSNPRLHESGQSSGHTVTV